MERPRVIRPVRKLRDVHPWRRRLTLALLALALVVCAIAWWRQREAAEQIAEVVRAWE